MTLMTSAPLRLPATWLGLYGLATLAARANAVLRVGGCAVRADAGGLDLRLSLPAGFQPTTLDVPVDGRSEGKAHRRTAPLDADGGARGNRVHHPAGNSPRNKLVSEASGLAALAEVVPGRLAGCMAVALPRVCVGVWHASCYRLRRPEALGSSGAL